MHPIHGIPVIVYVLSFRVDYYKNSLFHSTPIPRPMNNNCCVPCHCSTCQTALEAHTGGGAMKRITKSVIAERTPMKQ